MSSRRAAGSPDLLEAVLEEGESALDCDCDREEEEDDLRSLSLDLDLCFLDLCFFFFLLDVSSPSISSIKEVEVVVVGLFLEKREGALSRDMSCFFVLDTSIPREGAP